MRDLQYMIDVMTAARDGKKIEIRDPIHDSSWTHFPPDAFPNWSWNWSKYDYRIAPEPRKPREFWIGCYKSTGLETFAGHAFKEPRPPILTSEVPYSEVIHVREVLPEENP